MSYGYDESHDYTQGASIPESALNAEDFVIAGSGTTDHDANKSEAENSFNDLEPGDYLLRVIGFGKIEPKLKTTYLNGQMVSYESHQVEVRFADAANPSGRIRSFFLLPPAKDADLNAYNHGTNANGKAAGFQAQIFVHFIDRLFPGGAFVEDGNGNKVLAPISRSLANWKGRLVWAQVENGKVDQSKTDPTTGDPYPARAQIKLFSFKPHVEGGPCPFGGRNNGAPAKAPAKANAPHRPAPAAAAVSAGLDAI